MASPNVRESGRSRHIKPKSRAPRMSHILHRVAKAEMPVAVGGQGVELFDADGKAYIDASGGAAVSCLGHGHPDVIAAMHRQLDTLAYAHTAFFTTEVAERLADRLIEDAPHGPQPCLSRQRRLGGDRGGAEDGAAIFRREGRAAPSAYHRAAAELSRQHAGRAGDWRQRMAARAVSPAADRNPSRRPVFRLSPSARRRNRRGLCRARRAVAGGQDSRTRRRTR